MADDNQDLSKVDLKTLRPREAELELGRRKVRLAAGSRAAPLPETPGIRDHVADEDLTQAIKNDSTMNALGNVPVTEQMLQVVQASQEVASPEVTQEVTPETPAEDPAPAKRTRKKADEAATETPAPAPADPLDDLLG